MAHEVTIQPLAGVYAINCQVGEGGTEITLPKECDSFRIYIDTAAAELYVSLKGSLPDAPDAISATVQPTPKIIKSADVLWQADVVTGYIGLRAATGQIIDVRVEAYYQHKG